MEQNMSFGSFFSVKARRVQKMQMTSSKKAGCGQLDGLQNVQRQGLILWLWIYGIYICIYIHTLYIIYIIHYIYVYTYNAIQYNKVQYRTVQFNTIRYKYHTIPYQYNTIEQNTITLHYIALHCIALHYIILHYTTLHTTFHCMHTYRYDTLQCFNGSCACNAVI